MDPDFGRRIAAAFQQMAEAALADPVIFDDCMHARRLRRPFAVETPRHGLLAGLGRAVIAEKDDVAEAVHLKTPGGVFDGLLEGLLGNRDRAGKAHMPGRRIEAALGYIGQHGRDKGRSQGCGDLAGQQLDPEIVLADRHMRPVLLGAADRHDRDRLAGGELIAQFGPR